MRRTTAVVSLIAASALALALVGCSGASSNGTSGGGVVADTAAAKKAIAPYTKGPSEFPVTVPLKGSTAGLRLAIIDCGTPICKLLVQISEGVAKAGGFQMTVIPSSLNADDVASAFNTVIAGKYDGVLLGAVPYSLWQHQYQTLKAAGIAVGTAGVIDLPDGITGMGGSLAGKRAGALVADWMITQGKKGQNSVVYQTPEEGFTTIGAKSYVAEMKKRCPKCTVRVVNIPASTFGRTNQNIVVDDLTAHPDTTAAFLAGADLEPGVPQALKVAGIHITTIVNSPGPPQLAEVQKGELTAAFAADLANMQWAVIDSVVKHIRGQEPDPGVKDDRVVQQFVTADTLKGKDVSQGWVGYPDTAQRMLKLWGR